MEAVGVQDQDDVDADVKEDVDEDNRQSQGLVLELAFYGNYKEPNLFISLNEYLDVLEGKDGCVVLKMVMDPYSREWTVGDKEEQLKDEIVKQLWSIYEQNDNDE